MVYTIFITFLVGAVLAWILAMELAHRQITTLKLDIDKLSYDRDYLRQALAKSQAAYQGLLKQYRQLQARLGAVLEGHHEQFTQMHWEIVRMKEESRALRNKLTAATATPVGLNSTVWSPTKNNVRVEALRDLNRNEQQQRATIRKLREQLLELKTENAVVLQNTQVPSDISISSV